MTVTEVLMQGLACKVGGVTLALHQTHGVHTLVNVNKMKSISYSMLHYSIIIFRKLESNLKRKLIIIYNFRIITTPLIKITEQQSARCQPIKQTH